MLDTSWLDVIAYDPARDVTFPVEITIAVDIATRTLLAWRLIPRGTKAVDATMLIADAMTPEPMRPGDGLATGASIPVPGAYALIGFWQYRHWPPPFSWERVSSRVMKERCA
jgi:hypothetical protein